MADETTPGAATISFVGALAVLAVYWLHMALIDPVLMDDTGVSITIFLSAFFAQYIPLSMMK